MKAELKEQAEKIKAAAGAAGVENNFFFVTTFERYEKQLEILEQLEEAIEQAGPMVTKEYVKGRGNVYTNPAVTEYNKTTDSANRTTTTLMKIIKDFGLLKQKETKDPLLEILNA
jgi:hypothetical protein